MSPLRCKHSASVEILGPSFRTLKSQEATVWSQRDISLLILQQQSCGIVMLVLREATLSLSPFPCPAGRLCHTSVNYSFSCECLISFSSFSSIVFSLLPNPLRLVIFHLHRLSYVSLLCQTLFLTIFNCFSHHILSLVSYFYRYFMPA